MVQETRPSLYSQVTESTLRNSFSIFNSQRRYEAGVLIDVLACSSKPLSYRKLLKEVRAKVDDDQRDGLVPGYTISTTLLRATLGIMVDLGVVEKRQNRWSFTPLGYEVMGSH